MPFYERAQYDETHHTTFVFPASSADTCTITSGVGADTWSDYVEIVDAPGANSLSTYFATQHGDLTAMVVEDASIADEIFVVEISYGAAHIIVTRFRLQTETNFLPTAQVLRIRSLLTPAGETLYYRCMSESGGEDIEVHFRGFLH